MRLKSTNVELPEELHAEFKSVAAQRRVKMGAAYQEALRAWIDGSRRGEEGVLEGAVVRYPASQKRIIDEFLRIYMGRVDTLPERMAHDILRRVGESLGLDDE